MGVPADTIRDELTRRVEGEVVGPGDAAYDTARRVVNGLWDKRPLCIVRPLSATDVAAAVGLAATEGVSVAVRCGGHHVAGYGTCDDGLVIDLQRLNSVVVDEERATVRFGGGTLMSAINAATITAGFVSNGGTYESVGAGGLFLNGGVNYLVRKYGYACDQLVGAELVTANGTVVAVNDEVRADILWGLKGAGSCLGVVTELEAKIRPMPARILAGWLAYSYTDAPELLRFMRGFVADLPDELFIDVWFFRVSPDSYFPPELRGTTAIGVTLVYMGDPVAGERAIREIRERFPAVVDSVKETTYAELNVRDYDGGAWNERGLVNYWKGEHFADTLPDAVVDGLTEAAPHMPQHGDFYLLPVRGGMTRPSAADAAYGARTPGWNIQIDGLWREEEEKTDELIAWIRDVHERILVPSGLGYPYPNASMDETPERMRSLYGDGRAGRLETLKSRLDPDNMFCHNPQNLLWTRRDEVTGAV